MCRPLFAKTRIFRRKPPPPTLSRTVRRMRSEEEIRATLKDWKSSRSYTELGKEERDTAIMMLEWVLNDKGETLKDGEKG